MLRSIAAALCCALLPACTSFWGDPYVLVASTPSGADILVDGEATGLTTPAMVELDGMWGSDHEITLQMDGREPETRKVRHNRTGATSRWLDGAEPRDLSFTWPLWWTLGDWFLPFKVAWGYTPHEVHAVLYERGQAPVREDPP